jgi:hypothetical protein
VYPTGCAVRWQCPQQPITPDVQVLLTKLRKFAGENTQIICISATIGGLEATIHWLDATFFVTNYRPVKLKEHVVFGPYIYSLDAPRPGVREADIGPVSKKHMPSSTESVSPLLGQVPVAAIESVADAKLAFERTVSVDVQNRMAMADRVVLALALEASNVRTLCSAGTSVLRSCINATGTQRTGEFAARDGLA